MESDSEDECLSSNSSAIFSSGSESDSEMGARNWCKINPDNMPPAPPRFPFTGKPGIKFDINRSNEPIDYFNLFFDGKLIDLITKETNRFAAQELSKSDITPSSRINDWNDTNSKEMRVFISLIILQGIVHKPKEKWLWSQRPVLCTPFIGKVMTERRYSLIMKFLHFCDNEDEVVLEQPKLKKFFEIFELIRNKFKTLYIPNRDVSIDESLIPYKGRLKWKQFIATKRARFGLKLFQLCESESGFIWNTIFYTGKDTIFDECYDGYGLATKTVLSLSHDLLNQGYCITVDNFYNSPELAEILITHKTDIYGTLRTTRKNLPLELKKGKLKKGEIVAFQKGKILVFKWQDKKPVAILSTIHNSEVILVTKNNKQIQKPVAVLEYNNTMGGVDRADQCLTYYPSSRKQQKKHYKKIFKYLLDQVVWNSFILYKKCNGTLDHLEFRIRLVEQLIKANCTEKSTYNRGMNHSQNIMRLNGKHFASLIPKGNKKSLPVRKCVVCSLETVNGKRKRRESRYQCVDCDVGLCVDPCFRIYHTKEKL